MAIRVIIIVSGTVAQWECVWGVSYGELWLLAAGFVSAPVLQTLIGNNERQLLVLQIGRLTHVTHRIVV